MYVCIISKLQIESWYTSVCKELKTRYDKVKDVKIGSRSLGNKKITTKMVIFELSELYRALGLLESYCILNKTGVIKILKKHDKSSALVV